MYVSHVHADVPRSVTQAPPSLVSLSMGLELQSLTETDLWELPNNCKSLGGILISPFPLSSCPMGLCLSPSLPTKPLPLSVFPFLPHSFSAQAVSLCSVITCGNYSAYFYLSQIFLNVLAFIFKKSIHFSLSWILKTETNWVKFFLWSSSNRLVTLKENNPEASKKVSASGK